MEAQMFPTKPLLRPDQVDAAKDSIKSLQQKLVNPHIEDKAEVSRQLRKARQDFETQVPKAPENPGEEDRMVKRAKALLEQITAGMPSQEEMRKAPPGAVEKHREWERRNKPGIMEWKHIMCRLHAGSNDREVANLEKHRPVASSLNMDNAFIPGKQIHLPDNPDGLGVTFSKKQLDAIRSLDPEMADRIGTLTNKQRAQVKDIVEGIGLEPANKPAKQAATRERKPWTEEQKQALKARLAAGRAKKAAERAKE